MSRRGAQRRNYAEEPSSDFSESEGSDASEGGAAGGAGGDFELDDEMQEEYEEDDEEFEADEELDAEDRPVRVRGKYKQPGVKVMKRTGRQLLVRMRFADKYGLAMVFDPTLERQESAGLEGDGDGDGDEPSALPVTATPLENGASGAEAPAPRTKAQKLTEEELLLKKAEATRKRKHFIARKLEAEKKETLERLLLKRETKSASVGPESESRRELKKRVLAIHPALFSWSSKTELVAPADTQGEPTKTNVSYYSMVLE